MLTSGRSSAVPAQQLSRKHYWPSTAGQYARAMTAIRIGVLIHVLTSERMRASIESKASCAARGEGLTHYSSQHICSTGSNSTSAKDQKIDRSKPFVKAQGHCCPLWCQGGQYAMTMATTPALRSHWRKVSSTDNLQVFLQL